MCARILTKLISMAQSSGPHAFLLYRIQNRNTVDTMSNGRGIKTDKAIGQEVGAGAMICRHLRSSTGGEESR